MKELIIQSIKWYFASWTNWTMLTVLLLIVCRMLRNFHLVKHEHVYNITQNLKMEDGEVNGKS